jgi:hypothetical protein
VSDHQRIMVMTAAMIATMIAPMMNNINGLFATCRIMPNLVPPGSRSMLHFGHFAGFG